MAKPIQEPTMLSVIMPVYNEEATLSEVVGQVLRAPCELKKELILVNDCSSDESGKVADGLAKEDERIRVFHHHTNRGKGAAIRTAIPQIRGKYAIIQDADLEYDPKEYPALLEPLLTGRADVVFGSRFSVRYERCTRHIPRRRKGLNSALLGNRMVTSFSNLLSGWRLTDMETCYKLIPTDILRKLKLRSGRFGIEPELTARLAKLKLRIYEVPISYLPRQYSQGKKINWKDGLAALWHIFRFNILS